MSLYRKIQKRENTRVLGELHSNILPKVGAYKSNMPNVVPDDSYK